MSTRPHSVGVALTPNTVTKIFTVPPKNLAKWNLLFAYNGTSSGKNFRAWWYDASTNTEIPVLYDYPLATKEFLKFDGGAYVCLDEGDEIRVWIESGATDAGCIVTVELEQRGAVQDFL